MSEVVQQLITNVTEAEVKRWRKIGVKIDGTRVVQVPAEYALALGRLGDLEKMLSPEFQVDSKSIKPEYLSLSAKATKAPGIELYVKFRPFRKRNESGYEACVDFRLGVKDYPSYAPEVLDLQAHSGSEQFGNETMSSEYKFAKKIDEKSSYGTCFQNELLNTVDKVKLNLKVALALREYELKHS